METPIQITSQDSQILKETLYSLSSVFDFDHHTSIHWRSSLRLHQETWWSGFFLWVLDRTRYFVIDWTSKRTQHICALSPAFNSQSHLHSLWMSSNSDSLSFKVEFSGIQMHTRSECLSFVSLDRDVCAIWSNSLGTWSSNWRTSFIFLWKGIQIASARSRRNGLDWQTKIR